ncbi:MAG: ATP-dependent DNA helicase RecG [Clostridiales bacterium]|jgi:ATP-dependent DNA helicase RecG|nr:ATP-dependent DNA helicase RecG [Clostridiales bacterium]
MIDLTRFFLYNTDMTFNDDIKTIRGAGEKRAALLEKLGILTVGDLLFYYPRAYLDLTRTTPAGKAGTGDFCVIRAVCGNSESVMKNGVWVTRVYFSDDTGGLYAVWYNQPYMRGNFRRGEEYFLAGRAEGRFGERRMAVADYAPSSKGGFLRIVPQYRVTEGLSAKILRGFVKAALDGLPPLEDDPLPPRIREKYALCGRAFAIRNIHFPESAAAFLESRRRLVFDELLLAQAALFSARGLIKRKKNGIVFRDADISPILGILPYELTEGQKAAFSEIAGDFSSGRAANRLLQGDVGCGKTLVAALLCFIAAKNGFQAAIMAPTTVLAGQHFTYFSNLFGPLGIKTTLLTGALKKAAKEAALRDISSGEAKMVVATHAAFQERTEFAALGLVITDEQHRFGVLQRRALAEKGKGPHVLVMTATPIPRSLGLVLYGDMDISTIRDMPAGRRKIETYAVSSKYRRRVWSFAQKLAEEGRQVYFVCAAIGLSPGAAPDELREPDDKSELKAVIDYARELKRACPSLDAVVLHGKMREDEKERVMAAFAGGATRALVSTTVVEVGVNVPNAALMVVENAERFGLSALHQLRGRVGRGAHKSYCVLITDSKAENTKRRMEAMSAGLDGFDLAEADLELRGPGDFFGTRQHGLPEMRIANLYRDAESVKEAKEAAESLKPEEIRALLDAAGLDWSAFAGNSEVL